MSIYILVDSYVFVADVMNIDTSGIHAIQELHKDLLSRGIQVSPSLSHKKIQIILSYKTLSLNLIYINVLRS